MRLPGHGSGSCGSRPPAEGGARDPVCGMPVDPESVEHHCEHEGETYSFCCAHCLVLFRADPERYVGAWGPEESPAHRPPGAVEDGAGPGLPRLPALFVFE